MTHSSPTPASTTPRTFGTGSLFGVPFGGLGWFTSLLIGLSVGVMAFFAATFCAIVFILTYNSAAHGSIDFSLSYRRAGLPVGLIVTALALGYLGSLWLKRILRRS